MSIVQKTDASLSEAGGLKDVKRLVWLSDFVLNKIIFEPEFQFNKS